MHVYERFVDSGRPPTVDETAESLGLAHADAADAFRRLEAARVVVLAPGTLDIWMANPLCAVPTTFRAATERGEFWGSCAWDALGVVAMLGGEGTVRTLCPDCNEQLDLRVERRELVSGDGVAHFAVPARRWWENIAFT